MPAPFMPPPRDWAHHAACRFVVPDLFFAVGHGDAAQADRAAAKAICAECVVRAPCLEYALDTRQEFGVWGGLDEDELKAERRRRRAASAGAPPAGAPARVG